MRGSTFHAANTLPPTYSQCMRTAQCPQPNWRFTSHSTADPSPTSWKLLPFPSFHPPTPHNSVFKIGKLFEHTLHHGRHTNGKHTREKMFNSINHLIKNIMRTHDIPLKIAKIKKKLKPQSWQYPVQGRMWSDWNSDVLLVGIQSGAAPVEEYLAVQWAGQHPLALWPRNPTVRYLPREMKTYVHKTLYALFIMAFFIMARNRYNQYKRHALPLLNG